MHNLVYTDGIKKTDDVARIITKVRNIVKVLRYKTSDFHLIAKELCSLLEESDECMDDSDDESNDGSDCEDSFDEDQTVGSTNIKSLKLDVVTRWYSQFFMLESVITRKTVYQHCSAKVRKSYVFVCRIYAIFI